MNIGFNKDENKSVQEDKYPQESIVSKAIEVMQEPIKQEIVQQEIVQQEIEPKEKLETAKTLTEKTHTTQEIGIINQSLKELLDMREEKIVLNKKIINYLNISKN